MKIMYLLAFILLCFLANAQTTTVTTQFSSSTSTHSDPKSKDKVVVKNSQTNSSVSISNSDSRYQLKASFDAHKKEALKKLLQQYMENEYLLSDSKKQEWKKEEKGKTAYEVLLQENRLKINVDKELNSSSFSEKMVLLGEKISDLISNQ